MEQSFHGIQDKNKIIDIIFVFPDESEKTCQANVGENLLNVIRNNEIPIPCSCGGALSCSTCHVILDDKNFELLNKKGQEASEDEEDLLEVASGLKDTSRLGCQIVLSEDMHGMKVYLPK